MSAATIRHSLFPVWVPKRPCPGYWMLRVKPRGPEIPAMIVKLQTEFEPGAPDNPMERSPHLAAFIAGNSVELSRVWDAVKRPISCEEYFFQIATINHFAVWQPDHPLLSPRERVDFTKLPPVRPE